jgi:hypothetical protein
MGSGMPKQIKEGMIEGRLNRGAIFELLNNDRRRYAIFYLLTRNGDEPLTIGEMAERIAAWEHGITISEVSSRERKLVYNSLQQSHLPKLADFGVIKYAADRGTVEITEHGKLLEEFLYAGLADEQIWKYVYFGIGSLGLVSGLALFLNISPVTAINPLGWLLLFSGMLCVCSIIHAYREYLQLRHGNKPPSLREGRKFFPSEPGHSLGSEKQRGD